MGKGILHPAAALIIKPKNLVIGIAQGAHLHGAPLAHADAMAEAPGHHAPASAAAFHRPQLVLRAVDAHAQGAFQLGENVKGQRQRTACASRLCRDFHVQLGIQPAGRRVFGGMGRNAVNARNLQALGAFPHGLQRSPGLVREQALQSRVLSAVSVIRIHRQRPLHRGGVHAVKGVVLDGQVIVAGGVPQVLCGFRLPAVGGGIVGAGKACAVHQHNAAGGVHGPGAVDGAVGIAVIHLVAGGVHHIVKRGGAGVHLVQGIGAGSHGLGLERLGRGGIAHFIGQHAVKIILNIHMHHGIQPVTAAGKLRRQAKVTGVQVARHAGLGDFHPAAAAGCVTPEGHFPAHGVGGFPAPQSDFACGFAE